MTHADIGSSQHMSSAESSKTDPPSNASSIVSTLVDHDGVFRQLRNLFQPWRSLQHLSKLPDRSSPARDIGLLPV